MRIGIDARFLTHPQKGGFKTYTESLVAALARVDAENEYVLYMDRHTGARSSVPSRPNFTSVVVRGALPNLGMPWREQVRLARKVAADGVDLLHSPCLSAPLWMSTPSVVTVHDMLWFTKTEGGESLSLRRHLMRLYYRLVTERAARRADFIITVSQTAKAAIVRELGIDASRIAVTYEAADPVFGIVSNPAALSSLRNKYELEGDYVLALGSADPRKNVSTLLRAYAMMPERLRARFRLVILWTHPHLASAVAQQVADAGLTDRVQFLHRVPTADLVLLYNAASLFVFPSLNEGFGLPLLEAMACGTPVVASNGSCIPEIVSDAALLVQPQDAHAMAKAMARVLEDDELAAAMAAKGFERARQFSWDRCARETVVAYRRALTEATSDAS